MLLDSSLMRLLEQIEILTKKVQQSQIVGQKFSDRLGAGLEFSDYRQYQIGDDYRYIDWNLYSRLEQLFLKQFVDERDTLIYCLIDHSKSMSFGLPTKLNYAARLAAALGYIGLAHFDRVGAAFFSSKITKQLYPLRGKNSMQFLFEFLDNIQAEGHTDISRSLVEFGKQYRKGLAIIFSDFFDQDYQQGVLQLCRQGFEVWLIQILSEQEANPNEGDEVSLIDSELGQITEVALSRSVIDQYKNRLENYINDMKTFANRYRIRFLTMTNNLALEDIILQIMRRQRGVR